MNDPIYGCEQIVPDGHGPRILFLPASSPGGAGEFMRCRIIAGGIAKHWPAAEIHFTVNRNAGYAHDVPYPARLLDSSPAHASPAVNEYIELFKPDVAIFDCTGAADQFSTAKRAGAACVFTSARPRARRKGLRWNRVRWIDQHWVAQPKWATSAATPWEQLKKIRWPHIETVHLPTLYEEGALDQKKALLRDLGINNRPYVTLCAGGGGSTREGKRAADVFIDAADKISTQTGLACIVVLGPNYKKTTSTHRNVIAIAQLENAQLMGLLQNAELVVTGGGALLLQAMAQRKICVTVPVAKDQPHRIRRCTRRGVAQPARLSSDHIASESFKLLNDRSRRLAMLEKLRDLGLRNSVQTAVAAIGRLLEARSN